MKTYSRKTNNNDASSTPPKKKMLLKSTKTTNANTLNQTMSTKNDVSFVENGFETKQEIGLVAYPPPMSPLRWSESNSQSISQSWKQQMVVENEATLKQKSPSIETTPTKEFLKKSNQFQEQKIQPPNSKNEEKNNDFFENEISIDESPATKKRKLEKSFISPSFDLDDKNNEKQTQAKTTNIGTISTTTTKNEKQKKNNIFLLFDDDDDDEVDPNDKNTNENEKKIVQEEGEENDTQPLESTLQRMKQQTEKQTQKQHEKQKHEIQKEMEMKSKLSEKSKSLEKIIDIPKQTDKRRKSTKQTIKEVIAPNLNRVLTKNEQKDSSKSLLKGVNVYVLSFGMGDVQTRIHKKNIMSIGGVVSEKFDQNSKYLIADRAVNWNSKSIVETIQLIKKFKTKVVDWHWISSAATHGELPNVEHFIIDVQSKLDSSSTTTTTTSTTTTTTPISNKWNLELTPQKSNSESNFPKPPMDVSPSPLKSISKQTPIKQRDEIVVPKSLFADSSQDTDDGEMVDISKPLPLRRNALEKRAKNQYSTRAGAVPLGQTNDINNHIITELQNLQKFRQQTGSHWEEIANRKAIANIRKYPKKIESGKEARQIPGVGEKIAEHVDEILKRGKLKELNSNDPVKKAQQVFFGIWGAGNKTVKSWIDRGWRTIEDLKTNSHLLNERQRIGLKYYDEFKQRIPRAEVQQIEEIIMKQLNSIDKNLTCEICGSYRRGKPDVGDVDVLITDLTGKSLDGILPATISKLHSIGLLTDDLNGSWRRPDEMLYMGVLQLKVGMVHRRIDVRLYPLKEWPAATMYFTGSDLFNRSLRLWAKHNGYHLSDRGLCERISFEPDVKGPNLPILKEEDIFRLLNVEYVPPEQRDDEITVVLPEHLQNKFELKKVGSGSLKRKRKSIEEDQFDDKDIETDGDD